MISTFVDIDPRWQSHCFTMEKYQCSMTLSSFWNLIWQMRSVHYVTIIFLNQVYPQPLATKNFTFFICSCDIIVNFPFIFCASFWFFLFCLLLCPNSVSYMCPHIHLPHSASVRCWCFWMFQPPLPFWSDVIRIKFIVFFLQAWFLSFR